MGERHQKLGASNLGGGQGAFPRQPKCASIAYSDRESKRSAFSHCPASSGPERPLLCMPSVPGPTKNGCKGVYLAHSPSRPRLPGVGGRLTVAPSTPFRLTPAVQRNKAPAAQCECDTMAGLLNAGAAVGAVGRGGQPCPPKSRSTTLLRASRGTKAVSLARSVPFGRKRSGRFVFDFRLRTEARSRAVQSCHRQ